MVGLLVALFDELVIQAYISRGRTASIYDVVVDFTGYLIGTAIIFIISLIRKKIYTFNPQ